MYPIRTTPGFIIDSRPSGEASKVFSIFTRDLGLIWAVAQGVRLEKSKLRYHTREYSLGIFSFVRGKEVWRLTSAQGVEKGDQRVEPTEAQKEKGKSKDTIAIEKGEDYIGELLPRIASLLKRLLNGEDPHPELFDGIQDVLTFLNTHPELNQDQLKTFESLLVLRILHQLGYVGNVSEFEAAIKGEAITVELLNACTPLRTLMNQHINKALKESQL